MSMLIKMYAAFILDIKFFPNASSGRTDNSKTIYLGED